MTKTNATSWGYTIRDGYQRQYRSKPKAPRMTLSEFAQCAALVWVIIMIGWWIVFGGVV